MSPSQRKKHALARQRQQEEYDAHSIANRPKPAWDTYIDPLQTQQANSQPVASPPRPAWDTYIDPLQTQQASSQPIANPARPAWDTYIPIEHPQFSRPIPIRPSGNEQAGSSSVRKKESFNHPSSISSQASLNHLTSMASTPRGNSRTDSKWAKPQKQPKNFQDDNPRKFPKAQRRIGEGIWEHMDKEKAFDHYVQAKNLLDDPELAAAWIKENKKASGASSLSDSDQSDKTSDVSTRTSVGSGGSGSFIEGHPQPKPEWDTYVERTPILIVGRYHFDPSTPFKKPKPATLRFPVTGGKKFPRFSEFPTEIRNQIWELAIESDANKSEVRIKQVCNFRNGLIREYLFDAPPQRCHPLLLACRESRSIALPGYKLMFGTKWSPAHIRFNVDKDRLFLDPMQIGQLLGMCQGINVKDTKLIKRLAVPHREWTEEFKNIFLTSIVMHFRFLEELTLYVADVPNHECFLRKADRDEALITRELEKMFMSKVGTRKTQVPRKDENGDILCDQDGAPIYKPVERYRIPKVRIRPVEARYAISIGILNPIH